LTLLSIDPGVKALGWALWSDAGILISAGLSRTKERDLSAAIRDHRRQVPLASRSVVERMVIDGRAVPPGDLLDVQAVGVAVASHPLVLVRPCDWKGTIPKTIHHARIMETLSGGEASYVDALLERTPKAHRKEILDALGIGLHHLGRTNRSGGGRTL